MRSLNKSRWPLLKPHGRPSWLGRLVRLVRPFESFSMATVLGLNLNLKKRLPSAGGDWACKGSAVPNRNVSLSMPHLAYLVIQFSGEAPARAA